MTTDELYPIEPVEWNDEQAIFKHVMRAVVYRTRGIAFDAVKDTEDESAVVCQLWTDAGDGSEWMRWYSIDKTYLRNLDFEALVTMARGVCEALRDGDTSSLGNEVHGTYPE